jgi:hypothetical protein
MVAAMSGQRRGHRGVEGCLGFDPEHEGQIAHHRQIGDHRWPQGTRQSAAPQAELGLIARRQVVILGFLCQHGGGGCDPGIQPVEGLHQLIEAAETHKVEISGRSRSQRLGRRRTPKLLEHLVEGMLL